MIKLVEVGPRDGLQNETAILDVETRVAFIQKLAKAGFQHIEIGSFVSPKAIPTMANSDAVAQALAPIPATYSALVPNEKGLEGALASGLKEIAVFAAASDRFSEHNIRKNVDEALAIYVPLIEKAVSLGLRVRGYVSCVCGCPYEGDISSDRVINVAYALKRAGCYEISLGDTIGVGTPAHIKALLQTVITQLPAKTIALHCHDTYGQALANVVQALDMGVTTFDSAIAGLGGCPYAKGASGNLATEELLYCLKGFGIETGIDLDQAISASDWICAQLNIENRSKVARALLAKTKH